MERALLILVMTMCTVACAVSETFIDNQGGLLQAGSRRQVDRYAPRVVDVARWASKELGGELLDVAHAEEQVVAGLLYYLDLDILTGPKQEKVCSVKVLVQYWRRFRKLLPGTKCKVT